jgi:hypothetical protein
MPYHFEFDKKHRILLTVVTGEFSDDDQLMINTDIRKRATELDILAGIGDMSAITSCTVSSASVQIVAREASPYSPQTKRYLVAPADHLYGISRMYKATAPEKSRAQLEIVRSRDEALEALGALDAVFEKIESVAPAAVS